MSAVNRKHPHHLVIEQTKKQHVWAGWMVLLIILALFSFLFLFPVSAYADNTTPVPSEPTMATPVPQEVHFDLWDDSCSPSVTEELNTLQIRDAIFVKKIETLETDNADLREDLGYFQTGNLKQKAQIKRLKAKLAKLRNQ